jgi:hypothetical protein
MEQHGLTKAQVGALSILIFTEAPVQKIINFLEKCKLQNLGKEVIDGQ